MKFFAWFAGVDPARLAGHRSTSRYLVVALGMVLALVTGPIVTLAMGSYAYASLPASLGTALRVLIAICIGLIWMTLIWTIDRALIISSDAVGAGRRVLMGLSFAVRLGLAAILASIFSHQLVQFLYADILNTTAEHLALDVRERDAQRLVQLHGVPGAQRTVNDLVATASDLAEQYKTIPAPILEKFAGAERCEKQARQFAVRVNQWPTPEGWSALARKNAACRKLRGEATQQRDEYLHEVAAKISANNDLLQAARQRAALASANVAADRQKLDRSTAEGYSSVSARDVAFEALMTDHPEVRVNARLWFAALLLLELLPVLLKMMCRNNPAAAEAQADLAEDAAQHRLRVKRVQALEAGSERVLENAEVQETIDTVTAEYTVKMSHLTSFGQFADRVVREYQRQRDRGSAYPDLAARLDAAFIDALSGALDSAPNRNRFSMAAE